MIKINLLPPELRGIKIKEKGPAGPLLGTILATIVVLVATVASLGTAYYFWEKVSEVSKAFDESNSKAARLQKEYDAQFAKNEEMKKKWDRMKVQEEILNALVPEKPLLWSEKLNMISNCIPSGVYVTQLAVEESTDMVETDHSKQQRDEYEIKKSRLKKGEVLDEPPVIKKPIIKQTLSIKAVATGSDENQRFDRMLEFERALKGYSVPGGKGEKRALMDNFIPEIAIGTAESTDLDSMPVWSFEFKLVSKPFGYSVKEPAKP